MRPTQKQRERRGKQRHHYLRQILDRRMPPRGKVYTVEILHDDDCPKLAGGDCDCDAEVGPYVEVKSEGDEA